MIRATTTPGWVGCLGSGKRRMLAVVDAVTSNISAARTEIRRLGRTLEQRAAQGRRRACAVREAAP
ncbi:hypothetical protein [Arthrobacter sedimenti]|uniref:hypothetical protein n=1 Tax=Arthrobacter sedimenti TaxID=2694931 RepID=UPI001421B9D6|nr:hypothetical protein [Arthrobacter sedimenti]